nr:DUF4372 domain-containing protein [Bacteroides graminisolvens]
MNQDKYVFAQLVEFLNNNKFRKLVDKYDGNHYVKHFLSSSCKCDTWLRI